MKSLEIVLVEAWFPLVLRTVTQFGLGKLRDALEIILHTTEWVIRAGQQTSWLTVD